MHLALVILGVIATTIAAIAAVGAWLAARRSGRAADALTRIEARRWHAELTPKFKITCRVSGEHAALRIELVGPPGLDRLDRLTVRIRDDIRDRTPVVTGGPTAEEIARQVWGPYRFVAGIDGADPTGRQVAPIQLLAGDWRPFTLEKTDKPPWSEDTEWWTAQYEGSPIRLMLRCERQGDEPWTVPIEVSAEASKHATGVQK